MRIVSLLTTGFVLIVPTYGASVRDLKAMICCTKYSSMHGYGNSCTSQKRIERSAEHLAVGELVAIDSLYSCECVIAKTNLQAMYLGEKNGVMEFDLGSDGKADLRITTNTVANMDMFELSRCSDCSSLGSICIKCESHILFIVPPDASSGSGGGSGGTGVGSEASDTESSSSGLSGGSIAGIVIAVLLVVLAAIGGTWYYLKRGRGTAIVSVPKTSGSAPMQFSTNGTVVPVTNRQMIIGWTIFGGTIVSWIFAVGAAGSCAFLLRGEEDQDRDDRTGYGLFNVEWDDKCKRYSDEYKDSRFDSGIRAARTFAVFTCLLLSAAMVLELCLQLILYKGREMAWISIRVLIFVAIWTQLFTFFVFAWNRCDLEIDGVSYDCSIGGAGIVAIFNIFLLIGLTILGFLVDLAPAPVFEILKPSGATAAGPDNAPTVSNRVDFAPEGGLKESEVKPTGATAAGPDNEAPTVSNRVDLAPEALKESENVG